MLSHHLITRLSFNALMTFTLLTLSGFTMATETPKYTVLLTSENFEIREYAPMIVAKTTVTGSMSKASSQGFKNVADYIFGNNTSKTGSNQKISMTAPVIMEPQSEKIDMTTPVSLKQSGETWEVSFVMPSAHTMDTLPTPNSNSITLVKLPKKTYAVIRFSGLSGEKKIAKKTQALNNWIVKQALTPKSSPEIARYNPPWTPPFMRRNEIMIEIDSQ